jgi:RimK family alpha-L-glutamate ligase
MAPPLVEQRLARPALPAIVGNPDDRIGSRWKSADVAPPDPGDDRAVERARPPVDAARRVAVVGARDETNGPLVAAWRGLGLDAFRLAPADVGRLSLRDVVLCRLDVVETLDGVEEGLDAVAAAQAAGVPVLNPPAALLRAHDKLLTAIAFDGAGVRQPRWEHIAGPRRPTLAPPLVLKPRFGSWGRDVTRCDTAEALDACLAQLAERSWFRRHGALVQELLPSRGVDLRLLVARGAVIGAVERHAARGEWRTNTSVGGTRRRANPSASGVELGVAAAEAVGCDLAGIDLLPDDGGYSAIEANGAVDFDELYALPGRSVWSDAARALGLLRPLRANAA